MKRFRKKLRRRFIILPNKILFLSKKPIKSIMVCNNHQNIKNYQNKLVEKSTIMLILGNSYI
jgi:hypothetical protein